MNELKSKGYSVSTIEKAFDVINSAFGWANERGYLKSNPCNIIKEEIKESFKKQKKKESVTSEIKILSEDDIAILLSEAKGNIYKSEIQFVSPGQLLPYVMYITPVLNKYLQELQMQVFNSFENVDNIRMSKYYQPYSWLPHVTIGKKLSNDEMKIAFEVMQKEFVPFSGEVVSIGLSKVNPIVDVSRFLLA